MYWPFPKLKYGPQISPGNEDHSRDKLQETRFAVTGEKGFCNFKCDTVKRTCSADMTQGNHMFSGRVRGL